MSDTAPNLARTPFSDGTKLNADVNQPIMTYPTKQCFEVMVVRCLPPLVASSHASPHSSVLRTRKCADAKDIMSERELW